MRARVLLLVCGVLVAVDPGLLAVVETSKDDENDNGQESSKGNP